MNSTSLGLSLVLALLLLLTQTACSKDSPTGPQAPSRVTVTPASVSLSGTGQTVQLSAAVIDRNGSAITGIAVTWASSNASVATVSPTGLVTARQVGSATITATSGGVSGQALVTVEAPVATRIELSVTDSLMTALGQTRRIRARVIDQTGFPLTGTSLVWSSTDTTVATVDSTGLVTATGQGEADITAFAGASVGTLRIAVRQRPFRLVLSASSITLSVGATYQLTYTVYDANGHLMPDASVYYVVLAGSKSVVQVDRATGLITALKEGTGTVHAYAGGLTNTGIVEVTVVAEGTIVQPAVTSVSISPSSFTMAVQDTLRFVAEATDEDGDVVTDAVFTWSSSDESVVDVDSDGLATALKRGLATISASARSASAHAKLTVTPSERTSLAALYEATDGTNWTNASGWLGDVPLDEWFGVTVDDQGRVTGLALSSNNLEGAIPPALGGLAWLETLDLGGNPLSGPIPRELSRLDLKTLILDDTKTCVPETDEIISWLDGMPQARVTGYCGEQDRAVLIAFYNATNVPDWKFNEGWATEAPLNEWFGVTTDRDGRVVGYKSNYGIACNSISGSIPPVLGNLEKLEFLDLGCNRLTGTIPPELGNLKRLKFLSLRGNYLSGPLPSELGNLVKLEDFHLYFNRNLDGPIPPELGNLAKLDTLILSGNNLSGPIPTELGSLSNLERLSLSGNNLSGSIPSELSDLANLQELNLSRNQLTGPIPSELGNLSNLEYLYLGENSLSGEMPPELGYLTKLKRLRLLDNELTGSIPESFRNLRRLNHMVLDNNQLTGTIPDFIGELTDLTVLTLSSNNITGQIPSWIGDFDLFYQLHLDNNPLTGSMPAEIANLSALWELRVHNTGLSGRVPIELKRLANIREFWFDNTDLCMPADLEFQLWLQGIGSRRVTGLCENPDLAVLASMYEETNGTNWTHQANWLSERPLSEWHGVETDAAGRVSALELDGNALFGLLPPKISVMSQLIRLSLSGNKLRGTIPGQLGRLEHLVELNLSGNNFIRAVPEELGNLTKLERLDLSDNILLNGPIPEKLLQLERLSVLRLDGTKLCVPFEDRFTTWLEGIADKRFDYCTREFHPRAYLTQAVQTPDRTVPLIAGEHALLRVFVTTGGMEIDVNIPPVRASFYHDGAMVHAADIPASERSAPREIDEGMANDSANAVVPASVIEPGLEMVIEIDPGDTIDSADGIGARLPESGRMQVEVREVPPLNLTMVPFLWYDQPDRTMLRKNRRPDLGGRPVLGGTRSPAGTGFRSDGPRSRMDVGGSRVREHRRNRPGDQSDTRAGRRGGVLHGRLKRRYGRLNCYGKQDECGFAA